MRYHVAERVHCGAKQEKEEKDQPVPRECAIRVRRSAPRGWVWGTHPWFDLEYTDGAVMPMMAAAVAANIIQSAPPR